jgi:hypothetical protein
VDDAVGLGHEHIAEQRTGGVQRGEVAQLIEVGRNGVADDQCVGAHGAHGVQDGTAVI